MFNSLDSRIPRAGAALNRPATAMVSAAVVDIGRANTREVTISGAVTIASFGTRRNCLRIVRFLGAMTLTHNATSLILQTGQNRVTAAGDIGIYESDRYGYWREVTYSARAIMLFSASMSATMNVTSGPGYQTVTGFDTYTINVGTCFAGYTFTAPSTDWYLLSATIGLQTQATGSELQLDMSMTAGDYTFVHVSANEIAGNWSGSGSCLAKMTAGDTATLRLYNGDTSYNINGGSTGVSTLFRGARIGL
jgi:hypothetical protein